MVDYAEMIGSAAGGAMGGAALAGIIALGIVAVLVFIALYIYFALAWQTIAKKLKYKYPWLAWIPIANIAMIIQLGGFHWAWIFLIVLPIIGWVALTALCVIATWRIFERRKYPGWLSLVILLNFVPMLSGVGTLAYLVIIGIVAWAKK